MAPRWFLKRHERALLEWACVFAIPSYIGQTQAQHLTPQPGDLGRCTGVLAGGLHQLGVLLIPPSSYGGDFYTLSALGAVRHWSNTGWHTLERPDPNGKARALLTALAPRIQRVYGLTIAEPA